MAKDLRVFDRIRVKDNALYFAGQIGVVAYVGSNGVSAQIGDLDDYVPLDWDEIELVPEPRPAAEVETEVTALLDAIPGAWERTQEGLADGKAARVVPLDHL